MQKPGGVGAEDRDGGPHDPPHSPAGTWDRSTAPTEGLRNKRFYQIVARRIAQLIEANAGDPDWRLPAERELAEALQVSRPSVREAVIALEMRGIVEVRGRAGIVLLPARPNAISFEAMNTDVGPGPWELLQARLAVESSAASIAALRTTSYDLMQLEECLARMEAEGQSAAEAEKDDRAFHLAIANMTGNAIIVSMVEALWAQSDASPMWKKLKQHIHGETIRPLWIGDHHGILAALRRRNPDAAYKAMARHLSNIADELMQRAELYGGTVGAK
jgi:DNA-binding FadR family transcriptional regulator